MLGILGSIIFFLIAVWIVIAIGYVAIPVIGILVLLYAVNNITGDDNKKSASPVNSVQSSYQAPKLNTSTLSSASSSLSAGYSRWDSDWGNGIHATAETMPCEFNNYKGEGYQYTISATIPVSRLAKSEDAWNISGDRAQTLYGCWFKRSDGLVQSKMLRKKDSKLFQEVLNFNDGTWNLSSSQ